ncbi:MAG TPA: hypothetical protein VKB93_17580 [Thermoanaerobaculia bacterium]|nr:hypothetical protein [Thermoanaerobaculia bacterium]
MPKSISKDTTAELTNAVRELEARSCAEVVIEIRGRSGSYAHADARFAAVLALVALFVLLFSPWPFQPVWVLVDTAIAYAIGWAIARRSDSVRRLMTTERERATQVRTLASSVFFERGVANTARESGVVVYHGLLEQRIEILADRGVLLAVPPLEWNGLVAAARATRSGDAKALVDIVKALAALLETYLPRLEGDVDELANAPRFETE